MEKKSYIIPLTDVMRLYPQSVLCISNVMDNTQQIFDEGAGGVD